MMFDTDGRLHGGFFSQDAQQPAQPSRWTLETPTAQGMPREPLAIVGIGCRLPGGADDWQTFWKLLEDGRDAISETPEDRWNVGKFYSPAGPAPGKLVSRWGGYVTDIDAFDPRAFGISPREAAAMDPQQRMLLEVAWRAVEDAGIAPSRLAGQAVGVFVGISSFDHAVASLSLRDRGVITPYSNTGGSSSIAANRISYCFDLHGPSMAIDTACSSSLVAVHLACESIHRGETRMALAGGVNAVLMPDFTIAFSQLGVLSPDGRCKTFDAAANGYVRSEGAGMVLIKPVRDALADGDLIYAVIRGTATNQDGRTPGLTVPSGEAQQELIRAACHKAGIEPAAIGYMEAHGTGTAVGDPIEANAIGSVVGQGRPADSPCLIGSVKTNIGHLEAAAGIASLIKAALSVFHGRIPAHLHFRQANPAIDFDQLGLLVPTTTRDWPRPTAAGRSVRRLAGVNGFGYGGANAHVLLEEPPAAATTIDREPAAEWMREPLLVPFTARSPQGLSASAARLADWLEEGGDAVGLPEVAAFLAHRRSGGAARGYIVATDRNDLTAQLRQWPTSDDRRSSGLSSPDLRPSDVAFVFSGQGPQWWGMGRRLFAACGTFRRVIERCGEAFSRLGPWSLVEELLRSEADSRMHQTRFAQPAIFAVQVGIAAVWKHWGIEPTACVGHSVGEIAAAHVAGSLSFEDACRVAFHRGRTMDLASSHGGMLAVGLSRAELSDWVTPDEHGISIAAVNGPTSLTLSGPAEAIGQLALRLNEAGVFCRQLAVEYAFHSPLMNPVREELLASLADIRPMSGTVPLFSTVTGGLIDAATVGAEYWWQNVRQPVLFADAMACLASTGRRLAIEIGPHPVLTYAIRECFQACDATVETLPSLRRDNDDVVTMLDSLGRLSTLGLPIDFTRLYPRPRRRLPLPPEPFLKQRARVESPEAKASRTARSLHPLLGDRTDGPAARWDGRVDLRLQRYLQDHVVRGACVHPAAAYLEAALAAASQLADDPELPSTARGQDLPASNTAAGNADDPAGSPGSPERNRVVDRFARGRLSLGRLILHQACIHDESAARWMACSHHADRRGLSFAERGVDDADWVELATVGITSPVSFQPLATDLADVGCRCDEAFSGERLYAYCHRLGLDYGEQFRGLIAGRRRNGECVADVALPAGIAAEAGDYRIHPALLDACFHGMIAADRDFDHTVSGLYLPREIDAIHFLGSPGQAATVHVRITERHSERIVADLDVRATDGRLCLAIRGFVSDRVAGSGPSESTADLVYRLDWVRQEPATPTADAATSPRRWLLFADAMGRGAKLAALLASTGDDCIIVRQGDAFHREPDGTLTVDPDDRSDFVSLLEELGDEAIDGLIYLWALDGCGTGDVLAPTACSTRRGHSGDDPLPGRPIPSGASGARAGDPLTPDRLWHSTRRSCRAPLHLVQAWEEAGREGRTPCFFVTAAAQSLAKEGDLVDVTQTPLIGMGRVIASECGRLRTRLIDIAPSDDDLADLVQELRRDDAEDEVLLRSGDRWVRRFQPHRNTAACPAATRELPYRLEAAASAGVEELRYRLVHPRDLAAGEVEIAVQAAGLNFSDLMKALDLYPGLPPGPAVLGSECSGVISRVGPGVDAWRPGDEVMAVAPGSFASHVVVSAALVARKPNGLSHPEAAALPIAFLTAIHALDECGRVRPGERVLIHAASGGVGLAAMQLARLAGARVLATAGSDAKRAFVLKRGAERVFDSRSLDFAEEARRHTGGVDLILNSLPGEAIPRGIEALAIGGRFLEIGKRDIYADAALGLYAFRNNIAFFGIDLDQLFKQQPTRMGELLRGLPEQFESGRFEPLPVTVYPADEVIPAFREMQQARHIGKLVVDMTAGPTTLLPSSEGRFACSPENSYWVAGGLGGFGLEVARWLADRGAGTLILGGRSPHLSPEVQRKIAEIEARGTRVRLLPADITRPEEVRRVLKTIATEEKPLKGIFHTAMVLEDRLLIDLDRATLDRVLKPKLIGGWNLHHESLGLELDQFVLFSSLSSVFGHAGQANYAAANAALDGLAHYRRGCGLPATVINWGHLGEVGYLSQRDELAARLERQGVLSFTVQQAMACLSYAISSRETQLSVLRMDWTLWRGLGLTDHVPPKFAHLLRSHPAASDDARPLTISPESLQTVTHQERQRLIEGIVRTKTASLLGTDAGGLEATRPLLELGLDSLMAVELRNWIENQTGVNLPMSAVMRSAGVAAIAANVCERLDGQPVVASPVEQQPPLQPVVQSVAEPTEPRSLAMSAGQQGLWTAFRRDPNAAASNVFLPTRVRSRLDVEALRRTMHLVVRRHETLRTTFCEIGGEMRQLVHADLPPAFTVIDAAHCDLEEVRQLAASEACRPFDLEHGPLLRVAVFRLADDDWVVQATTHHIAVDFWSLILLLQEIAAGYTDLTSGRTTQLAGPVNNYAEFVHRQQQLPTSPRAILLRRYWQAQLADMPTSLELPIDRPRPPRFTGRAGGESIVISPGASHAIVQLAAVAGVTPSAVMLAAVEVLLARFSGQNRFLIGMPFSGRSQRRFENTVGFFVNMLPIPARLDEAASFRDLVTRVGRSLVEALEHEDYPLASIVADARCGFDPSRSPLFQVTCTFERSQRREETGRAGFLFPDRHEAVSFAGLRQESFHVPQQACGHDLEFVFEQVADGFRGAVHYCRDLFEPASITALARHLEPLVAALLDDPDAPLTDVHWPITAGREGLSSADLGGEEQACREATSGAGLPRTSGLPHRRWPDTTTAGRLIGSRIAAQPSRPAFVAGGRTWTYEDLGRLGRALSQSGADAGLSVAAVVPVVAAGQTGMLATVTTLLAGFAPVPIDAAQPALSPDDLLGETAARAVIAAGDTARYSQALSAIPVIDFGSVVAARDAGQEAASQLPCPAADDSAYCITTSGSTGRPKAVLVEQAALGNFLAWRQTVMPVRPEDRMLLTLSHQFDAALGTTLAVLSAGGTIVIAEEHAARDVAKLVDQLIREEISILPVIPSLLQLLVRHPRLRDCSSLREIWCGGEPLPPDLAEAVAHLPGITLWNCYGPTEATVEAAVWRVNPDAIRGRVRVPIGHPAAGAGLLVVDAQGRPVPDGIPGELVISGPGLARGYLGRPAWTAERFVELPGPTGSVRCYRTGDRCRRLPDGTLEVLGRLDDQVKIRGYRVELGEIEAVLRGHPAVANVAVTVVAAGTPAARLAAYVTPTADQPDEVPEAVLVAGLRRYLGQHLPHWKLPAGIHLIDSLPTTPNGKLDRSRLPAAAVTADEETPLAPPRTRLEHHLASLWRESLGIETVGITQNFFDLGGTSLQAAMLAARMTADLGVDVPTVLFFDLTDIAAIAGRLGSLHPAAVASRFGSESLIPVDATDQAALHPLIVPLRTGGDLPPLFMIHPPGGIVVCYTALARHLAAGRPVFGIRSRGLHGEETLPSSIETMASEYVTAIRTVQPHGPYLVGGWSLGGVIASEVANQLLSAGESVDRLLLLDSALPTDDAADLQAGREYGLDISLQELGRLPVEQQLPFLYEHARRLGLIDESTPETLATRVLGELQRLFAHHVRLCSDYRPHGMAVDAVLFRPLERPVDPGGPEDRGWDRLLRSVEVRWVPGHHHSMVAPPQAAALAAAMDDALTAATLA